jgi:hypothetical protein
MLASLPSSTSLASHRLMLSVWARKTTVIGAISE